MNEALTVHYRINETMGDCSMADLKFQISNLKNYERCHERCHPPKLSFSIFVFEEFCSSRYLAMTLSRNNLCDMRKQNGDDAMQIEISPQNNEFIDRQVARGEFRDRSAALDAAVELLRRRTDTLEKIDNGRQQLDAGEFNEYDDKTTN